MSDRRNRGLKPALDRLETREVLSTLGASPLARVPVAPASALVRPLVRSGFPIDQTIDPTSNRILNPVGTPTRHQALRLSFGGGFNGTFQQGPGRYSAEAAILAFRGKGGASGFLHGDAQLAVSVPTDPSVPATGVLTMFDKNRASGSALGLDLTAVPGAVDRQGRPTQFAFVVDDNISSGTYAGAIGQGTVQVNYRGGLTGPATLLVRGNVSASGTSNPLSTATIYGS